MTRSDNRPGRRRRTGCRGGPVGRRAEEVIGEGAEGGEETEG